MYRSLGAATLLMLTACAIQPAPATPASTNAAATADGATTSTTGDGGAPGAAAATVAVSSGPSYQLTYAWRAGDARRYRYAETAQIEVGVDMAGGGSMGGDMAGMGGGMAGMGGIAGGMKVQIDATSDLELKVLDVAGDGWAHVTMELTAYQLALQGQRTLTFDKVPRDARTAEAWISPRGEIVFARSVVVAFEDQYVSVATTARAADRATARARATASIGDQDVTIEAAIEVQTGAAATGAHAADRRRAKRLSKQATTLDVLPRQFLQMIVLPEAALAAGGRAEVATPFGGGSVSVTELDASHLAYDTVLKSSLAGAYELDAQIRTTVAHADGAATLDGAAGHSDISSDVGGVTQRVRYDFELAQLN